MENYIKQAYLIRKYQNFFENLSKNDILKLYTELDCVYSILEKLDIVCTYSKFDILKDFDVVENNQGVKSVRVIENNKTLKIPHRAIIDEIIMMRKDVVSTV